MLPPRVVRRLVLAPLLLVIMVAVAVNLPLLVIVSLVASPWLPGRWRALRLLCFALVWLALESLALSACLALWVASGFGDPPRSQAVHERPHHNLRRVPG